ncbi:hypothetical protein CLOM_g23361 [Closterium sp. NIES-68]|nr:hypothetical protein CLOM_g23361 [Closterium sp. NIES-68]GJP71586.1 hypothetical protein CLOP_g2407 [Closterium sp. NIES-67]
MDFVCQELSCGKKVEAKSGDDKNIRNMKYRTTKWTLISDKACFGRLHMPFAAAVEIPDAKTGGRCCDVD